jgi:hypothetical protein
MVLTILIHFNNKDSECGESSAREHLGYLAAEFQAPEPKTEVPASVSHQ